MIKRPRMVHFLKNKVDSKLEISAASLWCCVSFSMVFRASLARRARWWWSCPTQWESAFIRPRWTSTETPSEAFSFARNWWTNFFISLTNFHFAQKGLSRQGTYIWVMWLWQTVVVGKIRKFLNLPHRNIPPPPARYMSQMHLGWMRPNTTNCTANIYDVNFRMLHCD